MSNLPDNEMTAHSGSVTPDPAAPVQVTQNHKEPTMTLRRMIQQAIPRTYRTHCEHVNDDGSITPQFVVWRMWLGRVFDYECVEVARA